MKGPRIFLTHHVDLEFETDEPNGPGPHDRMRYERALLIQVHKLVGEDPIHVSQSITGRSNTFRFSGPLHFIEKLVEKFNAKGGTDVDKDGEGEVPPEVL